MVDVFVELWLGSQKFGHDRLWPPVGISFLSPSAMDLAYDLVSPDEIHDAIVIEREGSLPTPVYQQTRSFERARQVFRLTKPRR
jgi:hypothetical protein